ncbi:cytochrome C biogenesis protein [Glaesserella parasuis]|uniref:TPR domain-containing protein n=1 Tax=Glaesserella parasuis TaxID=738 RepID=UPI002EC7F617|nr:cytochrome C biogenesis protein [Glaesserella parasuis]
MIRNELNRTYYQQAERFADTFAEKERTEYLAELASRQAFEQQNEVVSQWQKNPLKRPLVVTVLLIALISSVIYYWQTGRYSLAIQGEQAFAQFQQQRAEESSEQRNDHYITNLQHQLRQNVNDGKLWFELGQAYSLNNDFEAALTCFHNAQTVLGEKASILGAMATADYYLNKQRLSPQAKAWLERALQIDDKESASLLLLASDAFLHNDFKQAIHYWEKVLDNRNEALDRKEIIQSIKMAEQMLREK